jgi:AraC family transcriptional regulator
VFTILKNVERTNVFYDKIKLLHEEMIGKGEQGMNYSVTIWTVAAYVESNMKQNLSLDHLVEITGFSLPYLREVYKERMGTSLSRYILERKIYNSAADLLYSPENATQIALNYGFTTYDTFTRAFKRVLGLTPSEFKRRRSTESRLRSLWGYSFPDLFKIMCKLSW